MNTEENCSCLHCALLQAYENWVEERTKGGNAPSMHEAGKHVGGFIAAIMVAADDDPEAQKAFGEGHRLGAASGTKFYQEQRRSEAH